MNLINIDIHNEICNDDQFVRSENRKMIRRRLRKIKDKLERMRDKMIKRLTSPISPLKGHIGIMENELKGRNHYLDVTFWLSFLLFHAYIHSFIH